MQIALAGERFALALPDSLARALADEELRGFVVTPAADTPARRIEITVEPLSGLRPFDDSTRNARLLRSPIGYELILRNGMWAEVESAGGGLCLHVAESFHSGDTLLAWAPLSSILRLVMACERPARGGLVLHASSVADGARAHVFAGVSGAGKSTVCDVSEGRPLLGDEISYVERDGAGAFTAYPLPFFSDEARRPRQLAPLPLGGIHLLAQDAENRQEPLTLAESLSGLLACVLNIDDSSAMAEHLLDLALALHGAGRVDRLRFTRSAAFWRLWQGSAV